MAEKIFREKIAQYQVEIDQIEKQLNGVAWLRFVVFGMGLGISWWCVGINPNLLLATIPATILLFGLVVRWNLNLTHQQDFFRLLVRINEEEIQRLEGNFEGFPGGETFQDVHHPYAADLDLFGKHSVFQLLNRSGTGYGRAELARWLLDGASPAEIRLRQAAVKETAQKLDWRQYLQAEALRLKVGESSPEEIRKWLEMPVEIRNESILKFAPLVLAPLFFVNIIATSMGWIPGWFFLGQFGLHLAINWFFKNLAEDIYTETEKRAGLIRAIGILLGKMEGENWKSDWMKDLVQKLQSGGVRASEEVNKFSRILNFLEIMLDGNGHFIINTALFWDIIWVRQLKKWKEKHASTMLGWFGIAGKFEAACSLGAVAFAFPDWQFPEVKEGDFLLRAEALGHPLIASGERVDNPVRIDGNGKIMLITGSNMAGKSTYLRTVGINIVLARAGGPVCGRSMQLSDMRMVTSMRTLDSIEESTSSFYAELKRLRQVLAAVRSGGNVIFLLDEILKGTNSRDRHAGAMALVRQLHAAGGSGMVSTHDLELAQLEQDIPDGVKNYSFHCDITSDHQLSFDYQLREGVCESMNATELMRGIGIDV